ncbi:hypothetical protein DEA8626_00942 [Defluviimonas aquaemixtae]|uniref:DUF3307 domain-containing protein n=1 Tax=Albidovulum aquaemixtae TaxID=1542388 RepID=A0A2R8B470_9RHOB|nr:DUF3307 domain-containing protein [Defluviimonas aquaemixtae]SPH17424.1 hypothetical protein DEA8626_00942 [Defluviimonas aquaemixtae]
MIETFTALLFAHVLADFVFQTGWIAANKRSVPVLMLHGAIVLATAAIALGRVDAPELVALAFAHLVIDWIKGRIDPPGLAAFLADQGAHIATLVALAVLRPDLWAGGVWAGLNGLPTLMAAFAGLILATRTGGFAVGLLMRPWSDVELPTGLTNGGKLIGILERGLIYLLVMVGQPAGIGFLIAAKSVLRFETTSKDQRAGEYVIIGTLASFGWAMAFAYGTAWLLDLLPPLEIAPAGP